MTLEEALRTIRQVCAQVNANLATHTQIQLALKTIEEALPKSTDEKRDS